MRSISILYCLLILLFIITPTSARSQIGSESVYYTVESEKLLYYSEEKLFVLLRIENISAETLTVRSSSKVPEIQDGIRYQLAYELGTGKSYKMKHKEWGSSSWKLYPGEIIYKSIVLSLEYHDWPNVVLDRLPNGKYDINYDIEIQNSFGATDFIEERLHIDIQGNSKSSQTNSPIGSENIERYRQRKRIHHDSCLVTTTQSYGLLGLSETEPYRNTMLYSHYVFRLFNMRNDDESYYREIRHRIQLAVEHPNEILAIELLCFGLFPKVFDRVYCEHLPKISATGDTRLHRYFREFVCKQK
jgi:hypothetical protein